MLVFYSRNIYSKAVTSHHWRYSVSYVCMMDKRMITGKGSRLCSKLLNLSAKQVGLCRDWRHKLSFLMKIICTQQLNNTPVDWNDLHITKLKLGNREWARNGIPPKRPWRSLVVQILRKGRDQGKIHALGYCMVMVLCAEEDVKGNGKRWSKSGHFPVTEAQHRCGVARLSSFGYFLVKYLGFLGTWVFSLGWWVKRPYTIATGIYPCLPVISWVDHCEEAGGKTGERGDFCSSWCPHGHSSVVTWGISHHPGVLQPPQKLSGLGRDATGHSAAPDPLCIAGAGDIPRPSSLAPQTPG